MKTLIHTDYGDKEVEIPTIDKDHLNDKANQLLKNSDFEIEKKEILPFIDLTSLNTSDTKEKIEKLCDDAIVMKTACVCVYPQWTEVCKNAHPNLIISVVGNNFPYGDQNIQEPDVLKSLKAGAKEIDMVINIENAKALKFQDIYNEIKNLKNECKKYNALLKVILEVGAFDNFGYISALSEIAIIAKADFIKTSTGKISNGANPESVILILEAIKKSNEKVGLKSSGGIRTYDDALKYFKLVNSIMGKEWIKPELFRIGASSLAKDLVS